MLVDVARRAVVLGPDVLSVCAWLCERVCCVCMYVFFFFFWFVCVCVCARARAWSSESRLPNTQAARSMSTVTSTCAPCFASLISSKRLTSVQHLVTHEQSPRSESTATSAWASRVRHTDFELSPVGPLKDTDTRSN